MWTCICCLTFESISSSSLRVRSVPTAGPTPVDETNTAIIARLDRATQGGFNRSSQHFGREVAMKRYRRPDRCVQAALRSPGRPPEAQRENCRQFWAAIASGRSSEDASVDAGVSPAVGVRWFRKAGGMPPTHFSQSSKPLSGRYLSFTEREEIAILRAQGNGIRAIARLFDRPPCTISRRLRLDFPEDEMMRISHEAIYQALYVQGRGALRRELSACLRTGRALRMPRVRTRRPGRAFVSSEIMISQRPAEAADRAVPGHWEGDLIIGLESSAIGTLVERTTRFTILLHLPRMTGHDQEARVKKGPALAGHGAEAVRDAITRAISTMPEQLRRSLTWDQGAELAQHARLKIDAGMQVYFCDPHSPWQRGTNENTNGLLRQYFPKGTDLSAHNADDLEAVALALNTRPRKTLGWKTPAETLDEFLRVSHTRSVATTD